MMPGVRDFREDEWRVFRFIVLVEGFQWIGNKLHLLLSTASGIELMSFSVLF